MKYSFFIFIFAFLLTMIAYTLIRGMQALAPAGGGKYIYLGMMLVLFGSFIAGMFFGNAFSPQAGKIISFIGYSYLIILVYLFFSFLLVDIIRIFNHFFFFISNPQIFRMRIMEVSMFIIVIVMIIGNYKFNHPQTVQLEIQSTKSALGKEIKIVAVSDIHLGVSIDKNRLRKYVAMINAQKPDLVLIAGDLIDRSIKPVIAQKMDEELRQIKAPMGIYAIFGNHEYFGEVGSALGEFYKKANITLLRDSSVLLGNELYIVGRDDKISPHRKGLAQTMANIDRSKSIILLDHQPSNLQDAEKNQVDFQFSGHTHEGQFFPGNLFVKNMFELGHGFKQKGKTFYYVSSGLGIWGPQYRIGSQSEMVVVKFKY
ncbi:MAG: metallophosphoesterase [Paludibacteraceae bacterium]